MKKQMAALLLCLGVMAAVAPAAMAKGSRLFAIDPDSVSTVRVRTGYGSEETLYAPQDAERIDWLAESLNRFEYQGTEDLTGNDGWYVMLDITGEDGTKQEIEIGTDGAFDPDRPGRIKCLSTDPDYFGESWIKRLFSEPFSDVNFWQDSSVKAVYDNGLMLGTSETAFSPEALMTRGMFVTVLGRLAGIGEGAYPVSAFADVSPEDYFSPAAAWAVREGIVKEAERFRPQELVTKEQAVLMLGRFAEARQLAYPDLRQSPVPDFPDLGNTSEEFRERLPALYGAYIVFERETGDSFGPEDTLTRRQAAEMFCSVCSALSLE